VRSEKSRFFTAHKKNQMDLRTLERAGAEFAVIRSGQQTAALVIMPDNEDEACCDFHIVGLRVPPTSRLAGAQRKSLA
jgi:hypothetical protein